MLDQDRRRQIARTRGVAMVLFGINLAGIIWGIELSLFALTINGLVWAFYWIDATAQIREISLSTDSLSIRDKRKEDRMGK